MKLRDYTSVELDVMRTFCNFTEDELEYFNLKASDISNIEISLKMNISTAQVSRIAKRVYTKAKRVAFTYL